MKRSVLQVFSLILILLVFCTLLSPKAQEEMVTLVQAKRTDKNSPQNTNVGEIAIEWKTADRMLYSIVDGSGWESGQRIAEVSPRYYNDYGTYAAIGPYSDYRYIYSASRDPVADGTVCSVKIKYGKDNYLLWHPESVGELDKLSNSMELLAKGENVALIYCWNGASPYFEHNMWYTFRNTVGREVRVYSMNDTKTFCEALPWVAAVFTALLCSILLWAGTCFVTRKEGHKKWMWIGNISLIGVFLGAVPVLCEFFDLPASLMPKEFILDIPHYIETFRRITASMAALGDYSVHGWLTQAAIASFLIAGISVLLTSGILLAEHLLSRRKEKL